MYDKLMEDTQNWVDELFENEATLLQGIIDNATANSDRIVSIVKQIATQAGYTISDDQTNSLHGDYYVQETESGYTTGNSNLLKSLGLSKMPTGISGVLELVNALKKKGYASGSKSIPYDQNNWIHAGELLYRTSDGGLLMPLGSGDKVFTKEMSDNLWNMAQMNLQPVLPKYDFSSFANKGVGSNNWSGDVVFNVEMYGVNDPQEFAQQIKQVYSNNTGNVRNMIQTDMFSGDSLAHKKYL